MATIKNSAKKLLSVLIIAALVVSSVNVAFALSLNSDKLYTGKNRFNHSYVLTSNQSTDIVAVARAQEGKSTGNLAYDDAWCAAFVSDCARLAGISEDIIPFKIGVGDMYNFFSNKNNATPITSGRKAGDIIIYHCKACNRYPHIGIVVDAASSIEGNLSSWTEPNTYRVRLVTGSYSHTVNGVNHSTRNGLIEKLIFRPNYENGEVHVHSYFPYVTSPTCTDKGYTTFFCACGDFYTDLYVNATGHDYHNIANVPASCISEGEKLYRCSGCYDSYVEKQPSKGHTAPVWVIGSSASCTEDGEKLGLCSDCGAVIDSQTIAASGHRATYIKVETEPTADHTGIKTERCVDCDAVIASYEFSAHNHSFGYDTVIKEATCTENGMKGLICSECNACYDTEIIEKNGHGETVTIITKAPACTEAGEETDYCTVCGNAVETRVIAASGHTQGVWTTSIEPTCTESGERICTCIACGKVVATETTAPTGHGETYRTIDFEATPDHNGQISERCSECHQSLDTFTFMQHEHKEGYSATILEPSCLKDGERGYFCADCQSCYKTEVIPAKGHDTSVWTYESRAGCTIAGEKRGTCPDCGEIVEIEEAPALGHDEGVWIISVPPACTTAGEESRVCTRCRSVIETREIQPLAHDEGVWTVSIKATCHENGEEILTCTACGEVIDSRIINATGHDDGVWKVDYEPTPEHEGQMSRYCSICNFVLETKFFGSHEHIEGYRKTVVSPTCTNEGEGGVFCQICSAKYDSYVIPALGHLFSEWYMNNDATHSRTCSRCHYLERNNCEFVSTVVQPTCTEGGYTEHICSICTFKYIDAYTDPLGHDWSDWQEDAGDDTHSHECRREGCDATETNAHKWSEWIYEDEYENICLYKDTMIRYCPDCGAIQRKEIQCTPCILPIIIGGTVAGATAGGIIAAWNAAITAASIGGGISAALIFAGYVIPELQKIHSVTYMVDGEVYRYFAVKEGSPVPVPENPVKDGAEFAGWTPEIPEVMPDHDLVFEAEWDEQEADESLADILIPQTGSVSVMAAVVIISTSFAFAVIIILRRKKEIKI